MGGKFQPVCRFSYVVIFALLIINDLGSCRHVVILAEVKSWLLGDRMTLKGDLNDHSG